MKDLKSVYNAANEEEAYKHFELFKEKWNEQYPTCIKSWYDNWNVVSPFFKYLSEIRKIIYTTNIIENLNRQYRKVIKQRTIFLNDQSLLKALYLATMDATEKWIMQLKGWGKIKNELSILHD